jgi:hypothetical protein
MNERISEIWDQAAKANALLRSGENSWETQKAFIEKFAELIVRECLDQLHVSDPNEDYDKGIYWSREQIKNHFGVEE